MKQRIITGLIFGIIVIGLLLTNDLSRLVLLAIIPVLSGMEYFQITNKGKVSRLAALIIATGGIIYLCTYSTDIGNYILYIALIVNMLLIINLFKEPVFLKHTTFSIPILCLNIVSPFILAILTYKLHQSFIVLFALFILIWIADSGAYFVGSQIGKNKLFPKISPGKTWEGFIGAGMLTLIAAYIISSLHTSYSFQYWIGFALISWILGMLGDLVASHVKRLHNIKDSGTILPGHGGFYDRFDAIIFVLPFILFYHTLYIIS